MDYERKNLKGAQDSGYAGIAGKVNAGSLVEAYRNVAGYEAVFDPDAALVDYMNGQERELADMLNPQHTPAYEALEGSQHDYLDELFENNPNHSMRDAQAARAAAQAGITTNEDGTHTLSWEGKKEVTANNLGRIVLRHL